MSPKASSLFVLALAASVASAGPTSGQTYSISPSAFPDLCVVPDGDYNGAKLEVVDCDTSDLIGWTWDGASFKNSNTGLCMDVIDGGNWNGNQIQTWQCFEDNTNQEYVPNNGAIQWFGQNMCIDLTNGDGSSGNHLQVWQCFDHNTNQQWVFGDVQEVDDCDEPSGSVSASGYASVTSSASFVSSTSLSPSSTVNGSDISSAAASPTSTIGGDLWTGGNASTNAVYNHSSSTSAEWSSSTSADWSQSSSVSWAPSASSNDWSSSSSASAPAASSTGVPSGGSGNADFSGYLQVKGTEIVDPSGNQITLRGTNLGGWLVWEDWMCGITDNSGSADRFPQTTLENRFGEDQTRALMKTWQDNWLVSSDFDIMAAMGFTVLRLPFSYRNFKRSDGTYITDSNGNLDLSRLDWAVAQAKSRGMYVIPTYHIWEGQEQGYSTISENTDEGQNQRNLCGELWTKIAAHFAGESAIAGFDAINEPTGSAGNILQRDLYNAIRAGDPNRIIIMESINSAPDSDWTNVVYSMHEYLMMGETDEGYNQYMFQQGVQASINAYTGWGVPTYIGEFMASGDTLTWMLQQMNNQNVPWSGWCYKTVNMDRWGLMNFGSQMYVDVSADSYDSLQSAWSNMGGISKSRVADQYAAASGGSVPNTRRSEIPAMRLEGKRSNATVINHGALRRATPHAGRSRRGVTCHSS